MINSGNPKQIVMRMMNDPQIANNPMAKNMVEMAKNGLGIACIPRRYILDELKRGELYEIKTTPKLPLRMTGVVVSKEGAEHSYALKEFIRILDDDQYK